MVPVDDDELSELSSLELEAVTDLSQSEALAKMSSSETSSLEGLARAYELPKLSFELAIVFTVEVDRAKGTRLGLANLDGLDGKTLMVGSVDGGSIEAYNKSTIPEWQVRSGDYIVDVNGISNSAEELTRVLY